MTFTPAELLTQVDANGMPRAQGTADASPAALRAQCHATGSKRRKTIAVAIDNMSLYGGGVEAELRGSLHAQCQELDFNLLLVYGRSLEEPQSPAQNAIYELLQPEWIDGLIAVSSNLSTHAGSPSLVRFFTRHAEIPSCSVGVAVPGIPSVVLDNLSGMQRVLEHLIRTHGCRRPAFIGGSESFVEGKARLWIFQQELKRHGIAADPALVCGGDGVRAGGRAAINQILRTGVAFDAVVAANDAMALGAIDCLRANGYHVPGDIPVTGFDDLMLARVFNPALTTAAQPFSAVIQAAMQMILEQLAGNSPSTLIALPCELVVRRSCGCNPLTYTEGGLGNESEPIQGAAGHLHERMPELRVALSFCLRHAAEDGAREADQVLTALQQALDGRPEVFHRALEGMLELAGGNNERYRALQDAIMLLRREFRPTTTVELEALWCDAIALIATANTTAQVEHRLQIDEDYLRLMVTGERISVTFDLASLRHELEWSLPTAGFRAASVACYDERDRTLLVPLVCLRDGVAIRSDAGSFPARQLFPVHFYSPDLRHTSVVFPLAFEMQPLGVAVFEYSPNLVGYNLVRDQISVALRTVALHQEVVVKTAQHERSVQERLATARRMQALSVLAGGVAHDLNNALGPLAALPDIILQELSAFTSSGGRIPNITEDIEALKAATLRASQTIKDLLTLGRQGRTNRRPLDLKRLVSECLIPDAMRFLAQVNAEVDIITELAEEPITISGSEAQLSRAISNLVRNAVEAIRGSGQVLVSVSGVVIQSPLAGFETIDPGDYALVTVTDSGSGISSTELSQIFEPFFSTKRTSDQSGTGLGLAIVHGVVKEHEGFVDVVSSLGQGTQFALYLPRVDDPVRASEHIVAAPTGQAKILVVDDDPAQLRTAKRVLSHLGYQVDTLLSGQGAFQVFQSAMASGESPYQLLIVDMLLNEVWDGLELYERILTLFPQQKAIVVSGHAPTERAEQALLRGLAWLAKPYTTISLASAVQTALGLKQKP